MLLVHVHVHAHAIPLVCVRAARCLLEEISVIVAESSTSTRLLARTAYAPPLPPPRPTHAAVLKREPWHAEGRRLKAATRECAGRRTPPRGRGCGLRRYGRRRDRFLRFLSAAAPRPVAHLVECQAFLGQKVQTSV